MGGSDGVILMCMAIILVLIHISGTADAENGRLRLAAAHNSRLDSKNASCYYVTVWSYDRVVMRQE